MITIQDILDQAHATADLVGLDGDDDNFADKLWEFAYATYSAAAEDEVLTFSLAQLEEAFNEPRGCPT